ncbi:protein roadkill-like [Lucilia sericata]|uniref:protein roadkill-like n=1 Tax=Lucilia sericata TaxID=13632 RepID=UPI0018A7FDA4|nr:protein roadkill-like [Lucilia sericata]
MSTLTVDDSSVTQLRPHKLKWTINDFHLRGFGETISSELFSKDVAGNTLCWKLKLFSTTDGSIHCSIFKCFDPPIDIYAEVSIIDSEGWPISGNCGKYMSTSNSIDILICHMSRLRASRHFPDNTLTIYCEIYLKNNCVIIKQSDFFESRYEKLNSDFANLFLNPKFADVTIKVKDGHEFKAHKAILSARSEVFAALFDHKMKENDENCVAITDVDSAVCEEMLRFIYSGKVKNLSTTLEQLLIAADKYQLPDLKSECERQLYTEFNLDARTNN